MIAPPRDHGGGLDAAIARYGGTRAGWLDLSTGINPVPYPIGDIPAEAWTALPDQAATDRLEAAARRFWRVPDALRIVPAPGASALIARMPDLTGSRPAWIPAPTYNEHAAAFAAHGKIAESPKGAAHVIVHPNNPDGRLWHTEDLAKAPMAIIDESFCDESPGLSFVARPKPEKTIILKSFGKFWGLAGLRLGIAIGPPDTLGPPDRPSLAENLGPWPVSGPALEIGARALEDTAWADATRARLAEGAARLDTLLVAEGAAPLGGTTLFRLYEVDDAATWQHRLAGRHVWSRIFPYSRTWLRLGLPAPDRWGQLEAALQ